MNKIVIVKKRDRGSVAAPFGRKTSAPSGRQTSAPSRPLSARPQAKPPSVWLICLVSMGAIAGIIAIICGISANKTPPRRSAYARTQPPEPADKSQLWMGEWMKKSGSATNDMLRASQKRVKSGGIR